MGRSLRVLAAARLLEHGSRVRRCEWSAAEPRPRQLCGAGVSCPCYRPPLLLIYERARAMGHRDRA